MSQNGAALNTKKNQAITALMSHATISAAAIAANVDRRTLQRWLIEPEFQKALSAATGEIIDSAALGLVVLSDKALKVIEATLDDNTLDAAVRLRASGLVFDLMLKLHESRNLEKRLLELEKVSHEQYEKTNKPTGN